MLTEDCYDGWKVYVHINRSNGKRYVGITSKCRAEQRWENGHGYCEHTYFASAIKKYGWDNFDHIVMFYGLTEMQAKAAEEHLISVWNTNNKTYGYNMTSGGDGTKGFHPTAETREKLSVLRRKENLSAETLMRRSAGLTGRKFSEEHKRKIGTSNSKPVEMMNANGFVLQRFCSAHDAEQKTGISHSHISQCCHGHRNTSGGYHWKFVQST